MYMTRRWLKLYPWGQTVSYVACTWDLDASAFKRGMGKFCLKGSLKLFNH